MPYITKEDRKSIDKNINFVPQNGGELQYAIAAMIQSYYQDCCDNKPRYKDMEAMMGALNGANLEHYRCVVEPYENEKMNQNGHVYAVESSKSY